MLGDTGVAVHPADARYTAYHGATLVLPLLDREIPLVLDESIEREFGTGAVKVTPGHDPADYERGARHRLPIVNLYEKDGRLNENAGAYKGFSREKARTEIVAKLDEARPARGDEALRAQRRRLRPQQERDRAAGLGAVVREDEAAGGSRRSAR
jgi:valyl-tRNA synthetase